MIKLLIMDVDGTLTDGRIYMGADGEFCKAFDIKDGYGIHVILPQHSIIPVIITGRTSKIVENRAKELGITELYQGRSDKIGTMRQVLEKHNCDPAEVAYIGDDVLDLPCMKICGVVGCPADSAQAVKDISDYICCSAGGHGAVREFIEWIVTTKE